MATMNISTIQLAEGQVKTTEEIALEKIPILESELALCKSDNERLEKQIDKLKEERDEIKEKLNSQSHQIENLFNKLIELSDIINELKIKAENKNIMKEAIAIPEDESLFNLIGSSMIHQDNTLRTKYIFTVDIYKKLTSAGYLTKTSLQNATLDDLYKIKYIGIKRAKMILTFANNDFKTVYA